MEDDVTAGDGGAQHAGVVDASLDEVDLVEEILEVVRLDGAEVVEHADVPAVAEQLFDEMRPDEPRSAGHQTVAHGRPPVGLLYRDCNPRLSVNPRWAFWLPMRSEERRVGKECRS